MSRILVTRPEPGASATADRLRAWGNLPIVLPLTRIERMDVPQDVDPSGYDAVMATSANALRHAPAMLVAGLSDKTIFTVGERTALTAREMGFASIASANGDAIALAGLASNTLPTGARLLYLAGAERGSALEDRLKAAGYHVQVVPTYDAPEVSYPTDYAIRILGNAPIDVALIYSHRSGGLLAQLIVQPEFAQLFVKTAFFAISRQAASALEVSARGRLGIADSATEDALLALLSSR